VIYVDISTEPEQVFLQGGVRHRFTEDLLRLMVAIGRQAALAVEDQRYQQALVKAERLGAVGQTIATLSHHIKNILQGVRGGSYLIDMGLRDHNEDVVRKGWNIVEKNQTKIYNLVMDMLTFSKERQPVPQLASVNETVQDVCELMQARAKEQNIALHVKLDLNMPSTLFDPEGLHRAVLNIVNNALDAVEGQRDAAITVESGVDLAAKLVFVVVTDNGPGISEEQRPKLFNLFESTKGGRGTGLGLAVSQKILREHGGEITVVSVPGAGAQFTLEWPLMEDDSPHASATQA
jgi:two-component system NtrC family sensor kinase